MSLSVRANNSSLNTQRQVHRAGKSLDTAFQRLSSGFRINSAKDDSAGMKISNRMTTQIQGLDRAAINAQDAISLTNAAEGAMEELTGILQHVRSLAVQAQDGAYNANDLNALNSQADHAKVELSRIATTTEFAGKKILDGSFSAKFLVGANSGENINVSMSKTDGWGAKGLGLENLSLATPSKASAAMASLDNAMRSIDKQRVELGALQNRFQSVVRNLSGISENITGARSRIKDTDYAKENAELTRSQIMQQGSTSILAQANQRPQAAMSLIG